MKQTTRELILLAFLTCFAAITIISRTDKEMLRNQVSVSLIFGIGGTYLDNKIRRRNIRGNQR